MGIDYDANFGIGYEVTESDELIGIEELEDGLGEYLYECDIEVAEHFCAGNGWSGDFNYYLTIKDPFKYGLDLTKAKEVLDQEMARLKLKPVGEFGEVGGLYIS